MNRLDSDLASLEARLVQIGGRDAARGAAPSNGARFAALARSETERLVERQALAAGVDPALVLAVTRVESNFDSRATSPAGAGGLMQLMPATATTLGVENLYDAKANVTGGATYLRELLERFGGDISAAVAAYNAGPGAVERYDGLPPFPETQRYVARVLAAYRAYRAP